MKVEQEEGWEKIRYRFIFLQGKDGYEEMTRNGGTISFITVWMETTCQLVQHISTLSQLFDRYVFFYSMAMHGHSTIQIYRLFIHFFQAIYIFVTCQQVCI